MPATYAAVHAALTEAAAALPGFAPISLVDAGAGPGTASWAALDIWPGLREITLLEKDVSMAALGQSFATRSPSPALRGGAWVMTDLTGDWTAPRSDIVIVSYALNELPEDNQASVVQKLWDSAQTLVIVEPGTVAGFQRIQKTREMLLESGAAIAAPCPGGSPCPEAGGWCHFSARVARSRAHRQMKGGELGYEDEKYSYLVATRQACAPCAARVLRHPKLFKGYVELELCTACGRKAVTVSKRMEAYRAARDLKWGGAAPAIPGRAGKESR